MYTRLLCVLVGLKLTRLATASKSYEQSSLTENTNKIKQGEIYRMYNYYRLGVNGTLLVCTVFIKVLGRNRQTENKRNINIFTSTTQLSETTRQRCNSMYNILHYMYTFHIKRYEMLIHTFMAGIETI